MAGVSIALVYFSATHVTKTCAEAIRDELNANGCQVTLIDVTPYLSRQEPLPVDGYDGLIFGFPVFADFAPSVINEWIPTLDGKGKKCAMFFTYGARTTGYAHFHTKMLLEQAGFDVRCSAEFLGRHSFNVGGWQVLRDRPDERDFRIAQEFARVVIKRVKDNALKGLELQKPFGYHLAVKALNSMVEETERGWFHPRRVADECQMCRLCEIRCPNQAFDAESGLSDPRRCIRCMHCVYICPDKALKLDKRVETDAYPGFLADFNLTDDIINAKTSKILTESWQAAQ